MKKGRDARVVWGDGFLRRAIFPVLLILLFSIVLPLGLSAQKAGARNVASIGASDLGGLEAAIPILHNITPGGGHIGDIVAVNGSDFGSTQGGSFVSFGAVKSSQYNSWSDTKILCQVPAGIYGEVGVTVTTVDGNAGPLPFIVWPEITSIDPQAGNVGSEVTIRGVAFGPDRDDSWVAFYRAGDMKPYEATEYPYWSDNEIRCLVPRMPTDKIIVTVFLDFNIYSNSVDFEVIRFAVGFAEGYTGNNFQQYLCIGNPNDSPTEIEIWYLFPDSTYLDDKKTVPAASRLTIDVNNYINPYFEQGSEVSAVVFSDLEVVVERPMYFNYQGRWAGGHDVVATPYVSRLWFFAEGYTGPGFEEYICVLNLGGEPANLTFHFQTEAAGEIDRTDSVPPASRRTFKVNELLGADYQCSLVLESDQSVVVERPMYFDYTGTGNRHWEGGHCVMGETRPAQEFYFAEGTTRSGFEEWITIQNPFPETITVIATYQLGEGQGPPVMKSYVIPPEHRHTVNVYEEVGGDKDVSVKLASESYFLAERPMYFDYTGYGASWKGGHCVIGASELSSTYFFAEGCTGDGFHEWICLQNPSGEDAVVEVSYLGNSGPVAIKQYTVPAKTRKTLRVNDEAGNGLELSCLLQVVSGPPIMAERPMYFSFRGRDDGHDVVGYSPSSPWATTSSYGSSELEQPTLLRDHTWEPGERINKR